MDKKIGVCRLQCETGKGINTFWSASAVEIRYLQCIIECVLTVVSITIDDLSARTEWVVNHKAKVGSAQ